MQERFSGFEESKKGFTGIPDQFFSDLLPAIADINELKLVIYILWSVYKQGDFGVAFTIEGLLSDQKMVAGLLKNEEDPQQVLETAVELALRDNILVECVSPEGDKHLFINSPRGRQVAELIAKGQESGAPPAGAATLDMVQPNIFQMYEENIGPLTPLVADMLRDTEDTYPVEWIREAIEIAVQNNVRRWKYIESILARWQEEGRDGTHQRNAQEDYRRYLKGKYGQFGEH
jgi:DnaD/phage-associated family protein